ncbi:hypothetical protein [Nonomuraea insulae]|uniref:Uncharacterized protein n=1 Tax=Nonomuraea insulae TaxID=1616787 RepID=A0ABW1CUI6_9ACTN
MGAELEAEYPFNDPLRRENLRAFYRFETASGGDGSGNGFHLSGWGRGERGAGPAWADPAAWR